MSTGIEALRQAVGLAGGQSRLAKLIGGRVRQQHVCYWLKHGRLPAEYVIAIERATEGRVTRHQLRPDLYPVAEPAEREKAAA